jgi:alkylation response protein AidB-like acyl-CoA dehydrogenase
VHAIAASVVAPAAAATDREARWVDAGIRALQQEGLGGLVVPRNVGGLGYGLRTLVQVCEILGRECASTAICFGMHCVGSAVIAAKATPDHVERFLRPIVAGTHLTTLSLSEPGSGAHFYIPQTEARSDDGFYVLRGAKTFVTSGSHADSYVISIAADGTDTSPGEFSCLVLRDGLPGMTWGESWHGLGMRGNDSRNLAMRNVRVPREDMLGDPGDEIWYVFNVIAPYFLVAMSGTYLGVASAALDEARAHLATRRYTTGGGGPANAQVMQHRLGQLWAVVERSRRLVYHAAEEADAGGETALLALCAAKAEVAEAAERVTNDALTIGGGIAYRENEKLTRLLRDARAAHVMAPTTDMLRTWTGRALLGLPLLGE